MFVVESKLPLDSSLSDWELEVPELLVRGSSAVNVKSIRQAYTQEEEINKQACECFVSLSSPSTHQLFSPTCWPLANLYIDD